MKADSRDTLRPPVCASRSQHQEAAAGAPRACNCIGWPVRAYMQGEPWPLVAVVGPSGPCLLPPTVISLLELPPQCKSVSWSTRKVLLSAMCLVWMCHRAMCHVCHVPCVDMS